MTKAVILARVSSKDQEEGHSLDAQIRNLELYAQRKGLTIIKQFTTIESSTKGDRPEFMRMIDFITAQKDKVAVIVDTVDRLQRSFKETPILNALMEKGTLELHFIKEGNVLNKDSNAFQKAMWNMSVMMAQSYTDQLSDNVKRSVRHKVSNGEWSGPAPLGYLNSIDPLTGKKTIIQDAERAFLIRKFFQEYSTGAYSLAELGRKANEWGLRSRNGNKISHQTIHDLVQNPFYYGMMLVKGELHPHRYEPLIDKSLYDACQAIRTDKARTQAVVETKHPFILRSLVKCAVSGRKASCDIKKGKHVYLISRDPQNPESKHYTKEETVLEQIAKVFDSIQVPEAIMAEIIDHLKKSHDSEKSYHRSSIASLTKENEQITQQLDELLSLFMAKSITKDMYDRKYTQLITRRHEIADLLERHHEGDEQFRIALTGLITLASKAAELFKRSTTDEKRQLIGYVFSNLELEGSKLRYTLKKPFDLLTDLASEQEWLPRPDSNQRPSD